MENQFLSQAANGRMLCLVKFQSFSSGIAFCQAFEPVRERQLR
jgi:hypothetical protein